jgi:hypothetical protein
MAKRFTKTDIHRLLEAAKAKNLPHPTVEQVFEVKGEFPDLDRQALETYLKKFCWTEGRCPLCDSELAYSLIWALQHGEATCIRCGYPARVLHYDVGPIERVTCSLPYHPSGIEPR